MNIDGSPAEQLDSPETGSSHLERIRSLLGAVAMGGLRGTMVGAIYSGIIYGGAELLHHPIHSPLLAGVIIGNLAIAGAAARAGHPMLTTRVTD